MKRSLLMAAVLVAAMALLSAPVNGQEKIIAGLRPGYSTLSAVTQEGLERSVVGHSPATETVRLVGLTDTLGWVDINQSEWDEADSALGLRRVNRFAAAYRELGWEVEVAGIETQTPHRGVRVEVRPREFSMATSPAAAAEVEAPQPTTPDTCCDRIAGMERQQKKMQGQLDSLMAALVTPKTNDGDTTLVFCNSSLSLDISGGVGYVFSRRISNTVPMVSSRLFFADNSFYIYGGIGESPRFTHTIGSPVREKISRFGIGYKFQFPKNYFSCREHGNNRLHKNDVAVALELGKIETSEELLIHRADLGLVAGELETLSGYEFSARLEVWHLFTGGAGIIYGDYDKVFAAPRFDQWTYSMYGGINPLTAGKYIGMGVKKIHNLIF